MLLGRAKTWAAARTHARTSMLVQRPRWFKGVCTCTDVKHPSLVNIRHNSENDERMRRIRGTVDESHAFIITLEVRARP
jgi:hypothetical protein